MKFVDILNLKNCLCMYQVQKCLKLTVYFAALEARYKDNYNTRSMMQNLLDTSLIQISIYETKYVKIHWIRD